MHAVQKRTKSKSNAKQQISPTTRPTVTQRQKKVKKPLKTTRRFLSTAATPDTTAPQQLHTTPIRSDSATTGQNDSVKTESSGDEQNSLPPEVAASYADIRDVSSHLKEVWKLYPTQMKPLQFPEWCLEKIIPTKPFTWVLDDLLKSAPEDMTMTKQAVSQLFIPLWKGYHQKWDENGEASNFMPYVDDFSPAASRPENGQKTLKYPQILHHHIPRILDITRHYYDCETGKLNEIGDSLFKTETVTEQQFETLYETTVLIRYLHHQETLQKYIKTKYATIADVALFDPAFTEHVRAMRRQISEDPSGHLRAQTQGANYDIPALEKMDDLKGVPLDVTNNNLPLHLRYRHYTQNNEFRRMATQDLKLLHTPPDHLKLLSSVTLPSDPTLHSLHLIAKQFSKVQMLVDAGMQTFPLKKMLTEYGAKVWNLLNLYKNPTEANKERFYQERGYYDLDSFYRISLDNRSSGGWDGKDDPILPYPLSSVADPPASLSKPLSIKDTIKYALKSQTKSWQLSRERLFGTWTEETLGDTTPYVKMLYTAKTVNQDVFGTGIDLEYLNVQQRPALMDLAQGKSFQEMLPELQNPTKSIQKQMLGLKHFSEDFRHLYENSEEFQLMVLQNFDSESTKVTKQLESAFYAIQRQHERWQYHEEYRKNTTPAGTEFVPTKFRPSDDILQRYNDQAYYLHEIARDLELWADAWLVLANPPNTHLSPSTGIQTEIPRERISDDAENRLMVLKWAPRQSSIFLEKWLKAKTASDYDADAEMAAWNDFMEANRVLHKFYTAIPDRRRVVGSFFTEFYNNRRKRAVQEIDQEVLQDRQVFAPEIEKSPHSEGLETLSVDPDGNPIKLWELNALPFFFQTEGMVSKPQFSCRPKGIKGDRRVISRFEFPSREDVHKIFTELKVLEAKEVLGEPDDEALNELIDFYTITPLGEITSVFDSD